MENRGKEKPAMLGVLHPQAKGGGRRTSNITGFVLLFCHENDAIATDSVMGRFDEL